MHHSCFSSGSGSVSEHSVVEHERGLELEIDSDLDLLLVGTSPNPAIDPGPAHEPFHADYGSDCYCAAAAVVVVSVADVSFCLWARHP